jgi:hypothetical protein
VQGFRWFNIKTISFRFIQTSVIDHDEKSTTQPKPGDSVSINKPDVSSAVKNNDTTQPSDGQKMTDDENTKKTSSNDKTSPKSVSDQTLSSPKSVSDQTLTSPKLPPLIPDAEKAGTEKEKS